MGRIAHSCGTVEGDVEALEKKRETWHKESAGVCWRREKSVWLR